MQNINNLSKKQDKELVELLMGGSQEAFTELYTRYHDQLFYNCKRYLNDEAGVEDIVQDIFMQLWETRDSLNVTSSFSGYLYTSAKNRVLNMFRQSDIHSRFAQYILANEKESSNETEDSIIDSDYTNLLNDLIESLPAGQKEIFRLSRIEGFTYQEIAEMLQTPVENVRKQVSRASKKIKELLSHHTDIHLQLVIAISVFFL